VFDKLVNDLNDRSSHPCNFEILIRAEIEILQRLPQHTGFGDIDGNELQNPILRDDADNHCTLSLIIDVHQRNSACARLEHPPTGFIERFQGVDRYRLDRCNSKSFLDV